MKLEELLQVVVNAADDKKAEDISVLDMSGVSLIADFFVICEGSNERQVQAIARSVKEAGEKQGEEVTRLEGFESGRWILIDINGIICHVFHKEERSYYNLERLWGDAAHIDMKPSQSYEQ